MSVCHCRNKHALHDSDTRSVERGYFSGLTHSKVAAHKEQLGAFTAHTARAWRGQHGSWAVVREKLMSPNQQLKKLYCIELHKPPAGVQQGIMGLILLQLLQMHFYGRAGGHRSLPGLPFAVVRQHPLPSCLAKNALVTGKEKYASFDTMHNH